MDSERRRRVLIVDDEANERSAMARMVERWGFVAETAADGQEALDKLPLFEPHAIVTDVMMPGMDGMELLRRLAEVAGAPPVIVLTAFGSIDAALTTVHEHGAFWFVEKPIRPRAFRVLLDRAVAHHRLSEDKDRSNGSWAAAASSVDSLAPALPCRKSSSSSVRPLLPTPTSSSRAKAAPVRK